MKTQNISYMMCIFSLIFVTSAVAKENILIINSYHSELEWVYGATNKIQEVLGHKYDIHIYDMDTKRIPSNQFQLRADVAMEKVIALEPSLVFLGDDNALKFLGENLEQMKIPTVFFGINNNPRNYFSQGFSSIQYVTGVLERPLLKRSLVYLKKIIKDLKRVRILFDHSSTSSIVSQETFYGKERFTMLGLDIHVSLITNMADWKKEVNLLEKEDDNILIMAMMHRIQSEDTLGVDYVGYENVAQWTSDNSPVPVFGFWNVSIGHNKAIGGLVLFGETQGEEAGRLAMRILSGTSTTKFSPVIAEKGRFIFSKFQLKKWNIQLPPEIESKTNFVD